MRSRGCSYREVSLYCPTSFPFERIISTKARLNFSLSSTDLLSFFTEAWEEDSHVLARVCLFPFPLFLSRLEERPFEATPESAYKQYQYSNEKYIKSQITHEKSNFLEKSQDMPFAIKYSRISASIAGYEIFYSKSMKIAEFQTNIGFFGNKKGRMIEKFVKKTRSLEKAKRWKVTNIISKCR